MSISSKAIERIKASLKKYQPIIESLKSRDVNEADTVTLVIDTLETIFGYDKYTEITSEFAIRGTYCDLAIKLDGKVALLIEVKAIGIELKESHVKQAVDYAANHGIEWVALTNGVIWRIYKIGFGKPITNDLVEEFNILTLSLKEKATIDILALLTKEGLKKSKLEQHHSYKQILNRFTVGSIIMSETVVDVIRREIRRLSPEAKISEEDLRAMLTNEVLKREVLEGEKADKAQKVVSKAERKSLRKAKDKAEASSTLRPMPLTGTEG